MREETNINPPWIEYPGSEPMWGGWRQGTSEAWLLESWLPFWKALAPREREEYLKIWPPPTEDWDYYLNVAWVD